MKAYIPILTGIAVVGIAFTIHREIVRGRDYHTVPVVAGLLATAAIGAITIRGAV